MVFGVKSVVLPADWKMAMSSLVLFVQTYCAYCKFVFYYDRCVKLKILVVVGALKY